MEILIITSVILYILVTIITAAVTYELDDKLVESGLFIILSILWPLTILVVFTRKITRKYK